MQRLAVVCNASPSLVAWPQIRFMSIGGYKIRDQGLPHFVSFAMVEWVDVFTRKQYRDILLDSLRFLQNN